MTLAGEVVRYVRQGRGGREGRIHPRRRDVQQSRRTTLWLEGQHVLITEETPEAALAFSCLRKWTL
jgi:hypothetical protein